jgi:hypothetical protein
MKRILISGAIVSLVGLLAQQIVQAQGNLVINGGFDTSATGWTITNIVGNGGYESVYGGNPPGDILLDGMLNGNFVFINPTASQTINGLISGVTYEVSGQYNNVAYRDSPSDLSFGVAIDGVFLFEAAEEPEKNNWRTFNIFYTATSSSATLSLSAQINGTSIPYEIDNISMQKTPEPSAISLILLGSGVLFYVRRISQSNCGGRGANALKEKLSEVVLPL